MKAGKVPERVSKSRLAACDVPHYAAEAWVVEQINIKARFLEPLFWVVYKEHFLWNERSFFFENVPNIYSLVIAQIKHIVIKRKLVLLTTNVHEEPPRIPLSTTYYSQRGTGLLGGTS